MKTGLDEARRRWPKATWIIGSGEYASVSQHDGHAVWNQSGGADRQSPRSMRRLAVANAVVGTRLFASARTTTARGRSMSRPERPGHKGYPPVSRHRGRSRWHWPTVAPMICSGTVFSFSPIC